MRKEEPLVAQQRWHWGPRSGALLAAVATFVFSVVVFVVAAQWFQAQLLQEARTAVRDQLTPYANNVAVVANQRLALLEGLIAFAASHTDQEDFDQDFGIFAAGLTAGLSGVRAVQIFRPGVPVYVYPVESNAETLGRTMEDLINDERPTVRADVARALETGQPTVSGPYELRQGGVGIVGRQAIFLDGELWGIATVVLDVAPLLAEAGLDAAADSIRLGLRTATDTVFYGDPKVFALDPVTHNIDLWEGSWELAAVPTEGWSRTIRGRLANFGLVGLSISALLAGLAYMIVNRQARLSAAVRARTAALAESERRYRHLFENNSDALFLLGEDGTILDANEVVWAVYGYKPQELTGTNLADLTDSRTAAPTPGWTQVAEQTAAPVIADHRHKDGSEFLAELKFSPLHLDERTRILCTVRDITEREQSAIHIRRLNRLYALLSEINQTIVRFRSLSELYEQVCEIAVGIGGFKMAWIGLIDEETARVRVVTSAGETGDYLDTIEIEISDDVHGRGPTATAIRSGKHVVSHDIAHDPKMMPWRDAAMRLGYRASAAFPLTRFGEVRGAFNLYAADPDFFDAEELKLLDDLARDISFAMEVAYHEEQRLAAEAARDRFARRMEVLHEIDSSMLRAESLQTRLRSVLAHCRRLTSCQRASISLLDPNTREFSVVALDQTGETLVDERFRMAPSALWLKRLEEGTIVVMGQDEMVALSGSPLARQLADEGLRSLLSAPLIFQGQPLGSLNLAADTPGYFTDEHREIVAEIVSQLAAAIGQEHLRDDLVRSTEALRISEARFRTAVEEAPLPMIIHAEDGEVITLNRIWTELTGYAHADIPTIKDWTRRAYGDLHQALEAVIERLYDLDEPRAEGEFAITCLDGTERIWDFSSTPLGRLPDGRRIELSMAADVTERRRAEVAQRRRLAELAALFNVASGLRTLHLAEEAWAVLLSETIVALDVEGGAGAVWLPRASTGKLHAEVTQGWMERLLDIPLAPTEGIVGAAFTTGLEQQSADWANDPAEHAAVAAQIPAGSGAYFVPIWAEEGVSGVLAIAGPSGADLTDQQVQLLASVAEMAGAYLDRARLWQQLRDQAQLTQQIIDTIPESVIVLDQEHQLVLANPAARTTFPDISGLQPGDFLTDIDGEPPAAFLAPTAVGEPWTDAMLGDPPRSFEVASQPLIGGYHDGGWVLVLRDVTEEHERQRYLLAQERLATVGQLAAGIAHDFNNIMGTISLYVELVQNEQNLTDAQQRHLGVISEQTRNAARLIRQIMDFSRHSDIELKPVNLASLFGETFELLQRTLPDNVALELRSSGARSFVEGDPVRLQQALMNLILNARDAMPAGGRLTLTLSNLVVAGADTAPLPDMPAGVWVVIEVTDTGSGIAPDHLAHLFEPFFTTKGPTKGTGLGLAQVYGIVKQHNGSIDVRSESGQGTTFTIYIPLVEPIRQSESDRSVAEPVPQGSATVLLVEDNAALRMAVAEMLTTLGYHVWEAEDGAQALARFEREQDTIQLILSDLGMPRMDGFELYARVQELNPHSKMIIMSGYLPEQHERMLDQENLAWIEKPFEIEELAHKMRSLLQSAPG